MSHDPENVLRPRCFTPTPLLFYSDPVVFTPTPLFYPDPVVATPLLRPRCLFSLGRSKLLALQHQFDYDVKVL